MNTQAQSPTFRRMPSAPDTYAVAQAGKTIGTVRAAGPNTWTATTIEPGATATGPTRILATLAALAGDRAAVIDLPAAFLAYWEGTGAAQGSDLDPDAVQAARLIDARRGNRIIAAPADQVALGWILDIADGGAAAQEADGGMPAARSIAAFAERVAVILRGWKTPTAPE